MDKNLFVLLISYLIGSLPTAIIVSRAVAGVDIREIGDGNMGARNVTRTLGWGPGIFVAVVDFGKGGLSVLLARQVGCSLNWQIAAGVSAVLGHDFPIYARFRGGQGMASILGTLVVFMPIQTFFGLILFGVAYRLWRSFDLGAALGLGLLAAFAWYTRQPTILIVYTVSLFLSIPAKKALDWPRRRRLRNAN
jgi:acyl phosphate:glycerol-3-phosphate acyltransferase